MHAEVSLPMQERGAR